jgi:hypothetical protein
MKQEIAFMKVNKLIIEGVDGEIEFSRTRNCFIKFEAMTGTKVSGLLDSSTHECLNHQVWESVAPLVFGMDKRCRVRATNSDVHELTHTIFQLA